MTDAHATGTARPALAGHPLDIAAPPKLAEAAARITGRPEGATGRPYRMMLLERRTLNYSDPYKVTVTRREHGFSAASSAFRADIEFPGRNIRIEIAPPPAAGNPANALENALRLVTQWLAWEHRGLVVHASAFVRNSGGAVVAVGPSGAGKSTLARRALESRRPVLGDDLVILRMEKEGLMVEGTPFSGSDPRIPFTAGRHPVAMLVTLEKGAGTELLPQAPAERLTALLAQVQGIADRSKTETGTLMDALIPLLGTLPGGTLRFALDSDLWQTLDS